MHVCLLYFTFIGVHSQCKHINVVVFVVGLRDFNANSQNEMNLQRVICLLSGSDHAVWIAYLREKALNEDERPAVRVRALMALQASLSPDQMVTHLEMHSYALDLRIKVLTFLSRLEFLGLVYRVTNSATLITKQLIRRKSQNNLDVA